MIKIKYLFDIPADLWYVYIAVSNDAAAIIVGAWSNGMTGVSKTLSGSSILSAPVSAAVPVRHRGFCALALSHVQTECHTGRERLRSDGCVTDWMHTANAATVSV